MDVKHYPCKNKMKNIIINCDDFGMTEGVSRGIVEAITNGVASSTTVMTCVSDGFLDCKRELAGLDASVGLHLQLTSGIPCLGPEKVGTLIGEDGLFHANKNEVLSADPKEIMAEWLAQYERFTELGFRPTHLDSHHHIHKKSNVLPAFMELSEKLNLPYRILKSKCMRHLCGECGAVVCSTAFYNDNLCVETLLAAISQYGDGEVVEVMCHPGYCDDELREKSSYADKRQVELDILTSDESRIELEKRGIRVVDWRFVGKSM